MTKKIVFGEITFSHVVYENINGKRRLILRDGTVLPESARNSVSAYNFFDFFDSQYQGTVVEKDNAPHYILTGHGSIDQLETLKLSEETIEVLNTQGLHIYLFEPIFFDLGSKKLSSTLAPRNMSKDQEYKIYEYYFKGFESTETTLKHVYGYELESIDKFVTENSLKNVCVFTSEYNPEFLEERYTNFSIKNNDIYLKSLFFDVNDSFNSYQYQRVAPNPQSIEYKFWSGNRRYTGYRHLISSYLADKSALLSYSISDRRWEKLENYLWFNLDSWKTTNPKVYEEIIKNIDMPDREIDKDMENTVSFSWSAGNDSVPVEFYSKCFSAIVTESRFAQPCATISEKTINAIKCLRPFVIVGAPYSLEYLKKYGVETFNDVWDESYDQETNHEKRLLKIFSVIDEIDSYTVSELQDLYTRLLPRLEHNYKVIRNIPNVVFPNLK